MLLAHLHIRFTHFHRVQSLVVTVLKFLFFALFLWPLEATFWLAFFTLAAVIDAVIWILKHTLLYYFLR